MRSLSVYIETSVFGFLANEYNRRRLKALTLAEGYSFHFDITTPEQVLSYE